MCGIAGIVGNADPNVIQKMTNIMIHRGPDDGGYWFDRDEDIALGHRRLSIIDLRSEARQPMWDTSGRFVLVYNGEIFNYRNLRNQLISKGYSFRTESDTEVVLNGFSQWGREVVHRLEGQFAFAVWDRRDRTLFAARDPLGVKPFMYARRKDGLLFASEAKALFQADASLSAPAYEYLAYYLSFAWTPHPFSFFNGVAKLSPGHFLEWKNGEINIEQYWDVPIVPEAEQRAIDADELYDLVRQATRSQLVADVPVGLFLSGGLDSTGLLECIRGAEPPVRIFTAAYSEEQREGDVFEEDSVYARMAAEQMRLPISELRINPDVACDLPEVVFHLDEPLADPTVIVNYRLTREAASQTKVLLSGMGADEIFAGYPRHVAVHALEFLPEWMRRSFHQMSKLIPGSLDDRTMGGRARRLKLLAAHTDKGAFHRFMGFSVFFQQDEINRMLLPEIRGMQPVDGYDIHQSLYENGKETTLLQRLLYLDQKLFLPCLNLENSDKTSMANSVEMRVPYLDKALVERVAAIPDRQKINGLTRKSILRKAFNGKIPDAIIRRKKTGFNPPVRSWIRNKLKEYLHDVFSSSSFRQRDLYDLRMVEKLVDDNERGIQDNALKIWALLVLETWHRVFVDQPPAEPRDEELVFCGPPEK
ncbi:MAG: asparagine synthase (glutamine-hydrolyzing) [Chlorobi bacterium]|nr:asparagine synthase (glutamine-hydrolyzing) [Chlorobiota bacterium]